jgi:hypothetical protein
MKRTSTSPDSVASPLFEVCLFIILHVFIVFLSARCGLCLASRRPQDITPLSKEPLLIACQQLAQMWHA